MHYPQQYKNIRPLQVSVRNDQSLQTEQYNTLFYVVSSEKQHKICSDIESLKIYKKPPILIQHKFTNNFYQQMLLSAASTLPKKISNKENINKKLRYRHTHHNPIEQDAMDKLQELSQLDVNRLGVENQSNGFTAWDGHKEQDKDKKLTSENTLKIKYRGFSFWARAQPKPENQKQKQKKEFAKRSRRVSVHSSTGKQFRNNTEENNQGTQKMNSSQIFVRKFTRKDKSNIQLAKRYFLNAAFKEDVVHKAKSFEAHSKTMLINRRRPKTGVSTGNLTRISNQISRNQSFQKSNNHKSRLDKIIAQSQKLMKKTKKRYFNKKLESENQKAGNPFLQILKQKYKSYVYAAETK